MGPNRTTEMSRFQDIDVSDKRLWFIAHREQETRNDQ